MDTSNKHTLDYRQAGVDIDAGNRLVERIKPSVKQTFRPGVLGHIGGFGGLFELPSSYKKPVLVSGTDGVGTKLKLAIEANHHHGIGIDLVAMCANDIVVTGAEPLYFLDYYATANLNLDTAEAVINSIAQGCKDTGMALIGGETAEMPGMYQANDYDLAGFAVGIVDKDKILGPERVNEGDTLIALASSGPHANGYSLIRKILQQGQHSLEKMLGDRSLLDLLLEPTALYVKVLLDLFKNCDVHACAHITGGGLLENLPRALKANQKAVLDASSWQWPQIFQWLKAQGNITETEMLRTFNCGIGMVVCLDAHSASQALRIAEQHDIKAWKLGIVGLKNKDQVAVELS